MTSRSCSSRATWASSDRSSPRRGRLRAPRGGACTRAELRRRGLARPAVSGAEPVGSIRSRAWTSWPGRSSSRAMSRTPLEWRTVAVTPCHRRCQMAPSRVSSPVTAADGSADLVRAATRSTAGAAPCRCGEMVRSGRRMSVIGGVEPVLCLVAPVEGDAEAAELVGHHAVARGADAVDGPEVRVGDERVVDGLDGFEVPYGGGHLAQVPQRLEPLRVARDRLDPGASSAAAAHGGLGRARSVSRRWMARMPSAAGYPA